MLLLGLDFETTGLDFERDRIVEMGVVLWDTDLQMPMRLANLLLREDGDPPMSPELEAKIGITNAMLLEHGQPRRKMLAVLDAMPTFVAFVAHNGNRFDRPMLKAELARHGRDEIDALWIDTSTDVDYPPEKSDTRKLVYLAALHGFLNPFAHRALFDVLTMLFVLKDYPIEDVLFNARQPTVELVAQVSFANNQLAKDAGYRWEGDRKVWRKEVKGHRVNEEFERAKAAGFTVTETKQEGKLDL